MAGILIDVFALITGSALGIIGIAFPENSISPSPLAQGNSLLRIGIGLNSSASQSLGGTVPSIKAYNEERVLIGSAGGSEANRIDAGQFVTVTVKQNMTFQQPTYLDVAGGGDAVCIAYLLQTWADSTQIGTQVSAIKGNISADYPGWLGDMGMFCGAKWYYSNLYVNTNGSTMYKPYCTWIGGNHSESSLYTYSGFRVHTPEFGAVGSSNQFTLPANPKSLCNYPTLEWYKEPVFYSPAMRLHPLPFLRLSHVLGLLSLCKGVVSFPIERFPLWKRDIAAQTTIRSKIVGSYDSSHSSTALCASPTSWGPDFVSFEENIYCDMALKKTWPLCTAAVRRNCYDWSSHTMMYGGQRKRRMIYSNVVEWK